MVKSHKKRSVGKVKSRPVGSKSPQAELDGLDVMNSARRKLKGALQDLMPHSDDESSSEDDRHHWNSAAIKRARRDLGGGRPRQGSGTEKSASGEGFKNSFIMKLFDRTVDLSSYTESTPLYPICRAWIANSSMYLFNRKSDNKDDGKNTDDNENGERKNGDIFKLPPPAYLMDDGEKLRVPKPIRYETKYPDMAKNDEEMEDDAPSRDKLLSDNLAHWAKVRNSWKQASRINEQRYSESVNILTDMFYNSQKNV